LAAAAAAAAAVVVYDFTDGNPSSIRLLLVREKQGQWSTFAGKIDSSLDATRSPAATAARELEEESHGLIPAAATKRLLRRCPQFYWSGGQMAFYMLRYCGGEQLPQLMAARLAGG
jgi:8-oxo-dGTP pyrophosphatase MutT (NUDIX family)